MAERHDILSLDRRDERLRQFIRKFMPLLVCRALDLMNLVQPVRDLFRSEIRQDILQKKLSPPLYKVKNISGITNLASGELCLILNMQDILHHDFNKTLAVSKNPKLLTNDILSYKKILVVDDSVTTRTMIKNILLNIGYTVDAVLDATEALVKLKINHYDLIITDITMPKIDGYEFIERLKNDEMYMDIPIIVMSSLDKEVASKKLKQFNIDGYLQKDSFDQTQFINMIKVILTKYHN